MTKINVAAICTGAFLGLLALVAFVACVPPITRFLGDVLCCPWRVPFTKKKRMNADEELGKDDLPYVVEPRPGASVDEESFYRLSQAHISALHVVDPAAHNQQMRPSAQGDQRSGAESRRTHSRAGGSPSELSSSVHQSDYFGHEAGSSQHHRHNTPSPPVDYYQHPQEQYQPPHHYGNQLDVPPPIPPHGNTHHWRHTPSPLPIEGPAYMPPVDPYHPDAGYFPEYDQHADLGMYDPGQQHVQPPPPSLAHAPSELVGHTSGYFPTQQYEQLDYDNPSPAATERLVAPRPRYAS